jgi:uncharacterized membrane protein
MYEAEPAQETPCCFEWAAMVQFNTEAYFYKTIGRGDFVKIFLAVFVCCFILCTIGVTFLNPLASGNIWVFIGLLSILLAVPITVFISLASRIEELEKSVKQLSKDEQEV